jgi:hypothetical protein
LSARLGGGSALLSGGLLLERDVELGRVAPLLEAARGWSGGLLVLAAPAGSAKTCLLQACGEAHGSGTCRCCRLGGDELVQRRYAEHVAQDHLVDGACP